MEDKKNEISDNKYNSSQYQENLNLEEPKSPQYEKQSQRFYFNIFRKRKSEDNPGFINRQMPAYWYDGKS
jgi:hypothetical protein